MAVVASSRNFIELGHTREEEVKGPIVHLYECLFKVIGRRVKSYQQ